jgi:uncharacterized protein (DUF608 family)
MAGPFESSEFAKLVPADKKLSPQWVRSLFERGAPTVYRGDDLKYIGMPIGGLCAGQLYLGGDGTLWQWDIFNQDLHTGDGHYAHPVDPTSPVYQGFTLTVTQNNQSADRTLDRKGFPDVSFCGQYPIGQVEYRDSACPVAVSLEAFSPFIPLNADDSSLPATVFRFTLKNVSAEPLTAGITGHLENANGIHSDAKNPVKRRNQIVREPKVLLLDCDALLPEPFGAPSSAPQFESLPDIGSKGLALLDANENDTATTDGTSKDIKTGPLQQRLAGTVGRVTSLAPGQTHTVTFVIAWHFPNLKMRGIKGGTGRHYATRFDSAAAVARYVAEHFDRLYGQTKLWHQTWYDSTLPHWFLDRTFLTISTLATSTAMRFADGRFYGWEGVGCCEGTCTHVWQYEQAMGRLFPEFDILLRDRVDFNPEVGFHAETGIIGHRGELLGPAVDGHAGTLLRAYRDHQMSADDTFLKRHWSNIKKATEWLIQQDGNGDGILEGPQHNTLDAEWFGPVAWLSGLYLAALRASEEMAIEVGDKEFATRCRTILDVAPANFVKRMWNGEYYVQIPDPKHKDSVGSYDGCEIDQVMGQSWLFQVGLGRVLPEKENKQALASIYKYNFTPDVGPFRATHKPGRWYAMPGEAGLLMCSWPHGEGSRNRKAFDFYFNECMNGFEHKTASHMIWEGMMLEGLAIERALHDRYTASRRNPWNEVECGDHYARSMASYGCFTAACGYAHHGPKGTLAFAPRLTPDDFKAAFTTAQGWGSFSQKRENDALHATIDLRWGKLRLKELGLTLPAGVDGRNVTVVLDGKAIEARSTSKDNEVKITFAVGVVMNAGQRMDVTVSGEKR